MNLYETVSILHKAIERLEVNDAPSRAKVYEAALRTTDKSPIESREHKRNIVQEAIRVVENDYINEHLSEQAIPQAATDQKAVLDAPSADAPLTELHQPQPQQQDIPTIETPELSSQAPNIGVSEASQETAIESAQDRVEEIPETIISAPDITASAKPASYILPLLTILALVAGVVAGGYWFYSNHLNKERGLTYTQSPTFIELQLPQGFSHIVQNSAKLPETNTRLKKFLRANAFRVNENSSFIAGPLFSINVTKKYQLEILFKGTKSKKYKPSISAGIIGFDKNQKRIKADKKPVRYFAHRGFLDPTKTPAQNGIYTLSGTISGKDAKSNGKFPTNSAFARIFINIKTDNKSPMMIEKIVLREVK
ncbi:MAG: hypothetical protein AB8B49_05610 [Nitratireductor sp.]